MDLPTIKMTQGALLTYITSRDCSIHILPTLGSKVHECYLAVWILRELSTSHESEPSHDGCVDFSGASDCVRKPESFLLAGRVGILEGLNPKLLTPKPPKPQTPKSLRHPGDA